jgi:hypothetical protein
VGGQIGRAVVKFVLFDLGDTLESDGVLLLAVTDLDGPGRTDISGPTS